MTEFEIIESLALYFDEYKHESEMKPHWLLLIKLFHQCSVGMINETLIKQSLPYQMCLYELGELFSVVSNEALETENKILLVNKNVAQGIAKKFKEENDKLKQALDTLIRKLDIRLTKTENYDTAETYYSVYNENSCEVLYPEEYELLKEVLKNDK